MSEITLMKVGGGGLMPADESSKNIVGMWRLGQGVKVSYHKARNIANHRRFFALVAVVADYSESFNNTDKALVAIKLACGHVDWLPSPQTGELVPIPKSISFAGLDEDEFRLFFDRAITGIIEHILPALDEKSLREAVENVMSFA